MILWSHIVLWTILGCFIVFFFTMVSYDAITFFKTNKFKTRQILYPTTDFKYWHISDHLISMDEASYMIANYWNEVSKKQEEDLRIFYERNIIKGIESVEVPIHEMSRNTTKTNGHAWLLTILPVVNTTTKTTETNKTNETNEMNKRRMRRLFFTIQKTIDKQEIHRITLEPSSFVKNSLFILCATSEMIGYQIQFEEENQFDQFVESPMIHFLF